MLALYLSIQQMRFGASDGHDAIAANHAGKFQHVTVVTRQQAVSYNSNTPRKLITRTLHRGHGLQVGRAHGANLSSGL